MLDIYFASIFFFALLVCHSNSLDFRVCVYCILVWTKAIKKLICNDFRSSALSTEEAAESFDLRNALDMFRLFQRFQTLSEITTRMSSRREEFNNNGVITSFDMSDIVSLAPKIKHLYVFSYMRVRRGCVFIRRVFAFTPDKIDLNKSN